MFLHSHPILGKCHETYKEFGERESFSIGRGGGGVLTTTSGRTSSQSHASIFPVRAKPDCTSSAIIKTLYFEHRSLTAFKYPSGGITTYQQIR